jgi:hypothetical protein
VATRGHFNSQTGKLAQRSKIVPRRNIDRPTGIDNELRSKSKLRRVSSGCRHAVVKGESTHRYLYLSLWNPTKVRLSKDNLPKARFPFVVIIKLADSRG